MKNRIYFLISAAIQIIVSVYAILSSNQLVEKLVESISMYPEAAQERLSSMLGSSYIILLSILCILFNIVIIWLAMQDKLLKRKGMIITFSIITFFTSMYGISQLLTLINIIVIASSKRTKKSDYPDKKEELPSLKMENVDKDKIVKAIIMLAVYYSQFIWETLIPDNQVIQIAANIVFYITMVILAIIFFGELLKSNFKIFKSKFKAYLQNILPIVGKFYLIYLLIASIVMFLSKSGTSVNQNTLESLPIFVTFPLAVFYAPLVEETLFRGCIRRFIKNDKIFIIISGLVFGLLHTAFSEATVYNAIILGIPYIVLGCFLAYLYAKTNNMIVNMSFHAFQNFIAVVLMALMKL